MKSNTRGNVGVEEVFDSRSCEIWEQELVQMARKRELESVETFGVYYDATVVECSADQCFRRDGKGSSGREVG